MLLWVWLWMYFLDFFGLFWFDHHHEYLSVTAVCSCVCTCNTSHMQLVWTCTCTWFSSLSYPIPGWFIIGPCVPPCIVTLLVQPNSTRLLLHPCSSVLGSNSLQGGVIWFTADLMRKTQRGERQDEKWMIRGGEKVKVNMWGCPSCILESWWVGWVGAAKME